MDPDDPPAGRPVAEVAAAAVMANGRVLAARRTHPAAAAGRWELPGGKVDPGETTVDAVVREVREELGCTVAFVRTLSGRSPIGPGYELTAHVVTLVDGEPVPREHDAVRWLTAEELHDVDWLPPDRPFLRELETILHEGQSLQGGNVGGAVRAGRSVRRTTGPWTPAVHGLLDHLARRGLVEQPRLLGVDERGREALTYLPGRVLDVDTEVASPGLLADAMRWLRRFHDAVSTFEHGGPWRARVAARPGVVLVCHHDFAPYNVAVSTSGDGDRLVGVFDWDLAGPGTRIEDLAFAAWNWVPLHRPLAAGEVADRLRVMAAAYDAGIGADDLLAAVTPRIERSCAVIRAGQDAGDEGMLNLGRVGEPQRTERSLAALRLRLPEIRVALARRDPSD